MHPPADPTFNKTRQRDFILQLSAMMFVQATMTMGMFAIPVLAPEIARTIGVPAASIALYTSLAYIVCVFSALFGSGLVPKFGALRVCQACLLLMALAFGCGVAGAWLGAGITGFVACALLAGAGNAPPTAASSHVLLQATPPRWVNLVFSIKQAGVPVGGALAGIVLPVLALRFSWQAAIGCMAAMSLVLAGVLQIWRDEIDADRDDTRRIGWHMMFTPLLLVWRNRDLRAIGVACGVMSGVQVGLLSIFVTYLTHAVGLRLEAAGLALATAQIAGMFGRVVWGTIADRTGRPMRVLAAIAVTVAAMCVLVGQFSPAWPLLAIHAVSAMFGLVVLGWNGVVFAEVARRSPGHAAEATGGILSMTCMGMVVLPGSFGAIIEASGNFTLGFSVAGALTALVAVDFLRRPERVAGS